MEFKKSMAYFIRHVREKHRLSVRNQHTDSEVWYMYISPINLLAGFFALVLTLFVVITLAVAYTPILDLIPGYPGNKSRIMLVNSIMRLDSLEQELNNMQIYSENIALVMAGKNPVTRNDVMATDSLTRLRTEEVARLPEDSLLRAQMEARGGLYSLNDPATARKNLRSALELFPPVKGVVTQKFNPLQGNYGIRLATTINQPVMSVMDGTVISSTWTPGNGYVIYVQHADNLLSVYRNNVSVLKKEGNRVRSGEVIGYTGTAVEAGATPKNLFEFELWHNGTPVDPQGYIVF